MSNMLENYGLDFLRKKEKTFKGFVAYITKEGKAIYGYYGTPYLYKELGDVEFFAKIEKDDNDKLCLAGFDTHTGNEYVWKMIHTGIDLTPKSSSKLGKVIMFKNADNHSGLLPIELINSDVLPSCMEDDEIEVQVVAHPLEINYYANMKEYEDAQPTGKNGKKMLVDKGSMMALSFLANHSTENYEKDKEYESDQYIYFTAIADKIYQGQFELGDKTYDSYISCHAETEYGRLEFVHTLKQVPKKLRKNIKKGSVISGVCVISGDVAINNYSNGIVKDFENNLKLLRYTFVNGEAERLGVVLNDNSVLDTYSAPEKFTGATKIIERFNYVTENCNCKYNAFFATIKAVDDENMEYEVGTRCIVLSRDDSDGYESICFITNDEDGMISKIKILADSRYHFSIDVPKEVPTPLDDLKIPGSVAEPIILRAKFHGIIDFDIEDSNIIEEISDYNRFDTNAQRMLDALKEDPQHDVEIALTNIFGYLFAKSAEEAISEFEHKGTYDTYLLSSYSPSEAFEGKLSSELSSEKHEILEEIMKLGTQFYKDFKSFIIMKDGEADFCETFKLAAVLVQYFGRIYAKQKFDID